MAAILERCAKPMSQTPPCYAGFWIRAMAYLVDSMVVWLISMTASLGLLWLHSRGVLPPLAAWWWKNIWTIPSILIGTVYFPILTKQFGATLGKMLFGLRVISMAGNPLGWKQVILRESFGKWASTLSFGLGFFRVAWSERKQGWHDSMAGTAVSITKPSLYEYGEMEVSP